MTRHVPVLLTDTLELLEVGSEDRVLDATIGSAGHARAICAQLTDQGALVGVDLDRDAVRQARQTLSEADCPASLCLQTANFRQVDKVIDNCDMNKVDKAVFDLGFRSEQLQADRGFSFQRESPLMMTYKTPADVTDDDVTAREIVNQWEASAIAEILSGYANEEHAERIAEAITLARQQEAIATTKDLVAVIKRALPAHRLQGARHPATKTFQALRMAVNDEVRALEEGLSAAFSALSAGGRLAVISFHSVEDRIVKQFFHDRVETNLAARLTDSPITPDAVETDFNPRARSAKLRCLQKSK